MTINRAKIKKKIRKRVVGTVSRPRLTIFRSLNNLSAQLIDDSIGKTLASANSLKESGSRTNKAKIVGCQIAKKAKKANITAVVFDRNGFNYRGVIQVLATEARDNGLEF